MGDDMQTQQVGNLETTATDNGQVQTVENQNAQDDKDTKGKELFDKGYKQGLKKALEKLGFEDLEKALNELTSLRGQKEEKQKAEETEMQKMQRMVEEIQNQLKAEQEKAKQLELDKLKTAVTTKLQEEYGFKLPTFAKLEGEDEATIEASARVYFDSLKEFVGEQKPTVKSVGVTTKPAQTSQITIEQFRKMTPSEKSDLFRSNPDLFKQLAAQI
ncbi:hypothetical protein [Brevibacillus brevis]|uniref:hypothetical protein n=1 Tax=Brevibacillus brevis TaxID=1393 RepID=UPI000D0FA7A3|nr:hypothetical protein [Brevibacillus brevis]PSJ67453.1 hypothetical protein C7J99_20900 [Brevibacillus brevis]RED28440.1 hypothetical protein DES34_108307 [Brevibacillus brevis]GEC90694.1 hypothetical protein BBR01nite_30250 [Brevibacillus brevis]VEF91135.1 Uncharacterised protein [Brevibacillus brevis]